MRPYRSLPVPKGEEEELTRMEERGSLSGNVVVGQKVRTLKEERFR